MIFETKYDQNLCLNEKTLRNIGPTLHPMCDDINKKFTIISHNQVRQARNSRHISAPFSEKKAHYWIHVTANGSVL